ncbi:MAG: tetratricopeptide repeat protein [Planctomycetes bacterium]|nr:tetratricopeptide repeat protein [Planctomycetota bacterium]
MYDRGIRHLQRGRSQEALECLEEAEARFPALPGLSYHLGVALFQLGEIEQAREKFEKMVPGDFYSAPASFYHALCRQQMGFLEEAQASLLGLEGRQDLYDFQEYLAYFLGVNFLKRSDPKKARTYFRKALGRWSPLLEEQLLETLRRCREGQSPKMAGAG